MWDDLCAVSAGHEGTSDSSAETHSWDGRFAELAERQAGFMFRVAHGLLRNSHDAEDAVQEALLKLFRGGGWREIADERAFLARTVWRVGLDLAARRARHTDTFGPMDDIASCAAPGENVEANVIDADERALLSRLIDELPEALRQPLILSAVQEMTSREAGAVLGLPEATVRTRVMRARAELRRRFERMQGHRTQGESR